MVGKIERVAMWIYGGGVDKNSVLKFSHIKEMVESPCLNSISMSERNPPTVGVRIGPLLTAHSIHGPLESPHWERCPEFIQPSLLSPEQMNSVASLEEADPNLVIYLLYNLG